MEEIKTKIDMKYKWIDELEAGELRNVLRETAEENDNMKRALVTCSNKSSVEIIKNTKGINVDVKVYDEDPDIASTKAKKIFGDLRARYGD